MRNLSILLRKRLGGATVWTLAVSVSLCGCAGPTAESVPPGLFRMPSTSAVPLTARSMAARPMPLLAPSPAIAGNMAAPRSASDGDRPPLPPLRLAANAAPDLPVRPGVQPVPARGVLHASTANFDGHVLRAETPVLVDFYADWCGPCKALAPTLHELAAENPQARIVKVNIDQSPELAERYSVHSVPSLLVFRGGRVVAREKGLVSKPRLQTMLDL